MLQQDPSPCHPWGVPAPQLRVLGCPAVRSTAAPFNALQKAFAPRMFSNGAGVAVPPPGSSALVNAALRELLGVHRCLLHLPGSSLGRCWSAPRPIPRGWEKSHNPASLVPGNCAKQSSCLLYLFPSLRDLGFVSLDQKVPSGVRCQSAPLGTHRTTGAALPLDHGCSEPWWVLPDGDRVLVPWGLCHGGVWLLVRGVDGCQTMDKPHCCVSRELPVPRGRVHPPAALPPPVYFLFVFPDPPLQQQQCCCPPAPLPRDVQMLFCPLFPAILCTVNASAHPSRLRPPLPLSAGDSTW